MRYIDVIWKHNFKEEPQRLVSEIGNDEYEERKLEFFPDGSVGIASKDRETKNTKLGIVVVPSLDNINIQGEFEGITITKEEFELLWDKYA